MACLPASYYCLCSHPGSLYRRTHRGSRSSTNDSEDYAGTAREEVGSSCCRCHGHCIIISHLLIVIDSCQGPPGASSPTALAIKAPQSGGARQNGLVVVPEFLVLANFGWFSGRSIYQQVTTYGIEIYLPHKHTLSPASSRPVHIRRPFSISSSAIVV